MPWTLAVRSVPHVFEKIFAQLNLKDRLTAAAVCRDWETAIVSTRELTDNIVLRIVCEDPNLLDVKAVIHQTRRKYCNVAVLLSSPLCDGTWKRLMELLKILNEKCAVEWFWCSAIHEQYVPDCLIELGSVFRNLQELELTVEMRSYMDATWSSAFQELKQLQSLTMHDAHCDALASVQQHCRKMRVLVLSRFGLTQLLGDVLDFPCLERLTVEQLFIPKNFVFEWRHGHVVLPQLRDISLISTEEPVPTMFAVELATLRLPMTVIFAPQLEKVRLSYLLHHFIDLKVETPRMTNSL